MASASQVKQYLAYWLQLGKKVLIRNGDAVLQPQPVIIGDRYSQEFERCWQTILSPESGECYLDGTEQTIAQLLTSEWELFVCSRCTMPIPLRVVGMPPERCPCFDLPGWPDLDTPLPRSPVNTQAQLQSIRDRLVSASNKDIPERESKKIEQHLAKLLTDIPLCECSVHPD